MDKKEVEYVIAIVNCSNIVWFKKLLIGMKIEIKDPVVIFCDNNSAINISKNPIMHTKTKDIAIKYHFLSWCKIKKSNWNMLIQKNKL